ncbi:fatty acid desaturase [Streptomyces griseus]|uniref:fatty acid desaturase n=1 Tax=Streptomyces griseus TaxID=1911 RepID=UPI002D219CFF|nr:fatty acid desaturase [Streptomyces griseus]
MFGQVALLAHDPAHRQVFRRRRPSETAGRIAGAAIGMGYGWWQDKHTRHHANPNHEDLDPDIAPDLLVWSQDQARAATGLPRIIGRRQAFLFFPCSCSKGSTFMSRAREHWATAPWTARCSTGTPPPT